MGPLEQGTIQFVGIGIRHNSNCDYGIGHNHYFVLCLIPTTPNELCLIPTYSVSFVPTSIHTIGPYSVCPSTVTHKNTYETKKLYGKIPALGESAFIFVTLKKYEDLTWKKKDTYFSLGIDEKW